MKSSLFIATIFGVGIVIGHLDPFPAWMDPSQAAYLALSLLLFSVGILLGSRKDLWRPLLQFGWKVVLIPISVVTGTSIGVSVVPGLFENLGIWEVLAVGAGFGYYSLSSVLIAQLHGEMLGTLALLTNIFREITTLLLAPFFVRFFGNLSSIAAGGATTMDTTLPVVIRFSGKEYSILAVFSGVILTLLVPILVTFFLSFN